MNEHVSIRFADDPAALAMKWAAARHHADACRKTLSELRKRRDDAVAESAPYDDALAELVDLRAKIQNAYVDSYLGDESPNGAIADMEQLATQKEANLAGLRDQASVAKAAADRLTQKVEAAQKAEGEARQKEQNAKEAWGTARQADAHRSFKEAFEALRPFLEEMVAASEYAPKPRHLFHLNTTIGDIAQETFDQLKRTTQSYPRPSTPFKHTWLDKRLVSDLPGIESARERLEAEIAAFMRGQP